MPHVVFIAPRFLENTNRYVRAFAALDITLSLVSEDPAEAIPAEVRGRVAGHFRVLDSLDSAQLIHAVRAISGSIGRVDRLAGVLEQLQLPMAEVRDAVGIEGLTSAIARNFRDKDRMKEVLRSRGVPVARSVLATSRDELVAFVAQVGYPVIVKPQAGLGSRATFRIESDDELAAVHSPTPGQPIQVEEFVRAREHTCETVTIRGKPVWRSGTRYFPSPLEVLETPWIQYSVLLPREADDPTWTSFHPINGDALTALFADQASTAAGTALTHMEWFLREDGSSMVNEVGARPPGVQIMPLMNITHDMDMFTGWAQLMALDTFTPRPRVCAAGSAFFRGQGGGRRIVAVDGVERAVEECGDALVEMRTPKVGQQRVDTYEGEGFAIVKDATTEGVKRALRALIQNVQVRYG
ncbi:MAG: ATP-grasp domain-containing protein [Deltaproteobacteria bacterium]|nr:ATP-grasp domain-containing protein [Deltaproteobacteria bacterium]MDQ3295993.1 ATP-grasp domain-containing protein [Myxococcota bacterium]